MFDRCKKNLLIGLLFIVFIPYSIFANDSWRAVGICGGGGMYSSASSPHDPKFMMVSCDMSGAYYSENGGKKWQMISFSQLKGSTVCAPIFHPIKKNTIYAVNGWHGSIKISNDRGRSWKIFADRRNFKGRILGLYIDPQFPQTFFVGTDKWVYRSSDYGKNWKLLEGVSGRFIGMGGEWKSKNGGRVYFIATELGVFKSDIFGKVFEKINGNLPKYKISGFAVGSSKSLTRLYITIESHLNDGKLDGGVYVSNNDGHSWLRKMSSGLDVATSRSSQWAHGDIPQYKNIVTSDKNPDIAYVVCSGTSYYPPNHCTIYRTDNGGESWSATFFSDPRFKEYNVEGDYVTQAMGQRYQPVPVQISINPANSNVVMSVTSNIFITHNGGKSWLSGHTALKNSNYNGVTAWKNNGLVVTTTWNYNIDPHESNRHYICYTDIGFARSVDNGESWLWDRKALPWSNTLYELAIDPSIPGLMWGAFSQTHDIPNGNIISGRHRIIMKGGVAVSHDFGKSWQKLNLPKAPVLSVIIDPKSSKDKRTLYASIFTKGVYKSIDGGKVWKNKSKNLGDPNNMRVCKLCIHKDGSIYCLITGKRKNKKGQFISEGVGLYKSLNGAESWEKITSSNPLYWIKDFTVNPDDSNIILLSACNIRGKREGGLYRTLNGGQKWTKLTQKGSEHFGAFYHPDNKNWIYMTLTEDAPNAGLWLSKDNGKSWKPFNDLPFANIHRVTFPKDNKKEIIVTTFGGSVFRGPNTP